MPIEFHCPECGKLLRVPDDAAGKQARCPSCGAVATIPAGPGAASPPGAAAGSSTAPFGGPLPSGAAPQRPGGEEINPFASPATIGGKFAPYERLGARDGPPWERDGPSVASFIETFKLIYGSTPRMFQTMRQRGGIGAPLAFGVLGALLGVIPGLGLQVLLELVVGRAGAQELITLVVTAIAMPLMATIVLFVHAAVYHIMLMVFGGANYGLETTLRVVCYAAGASGPLTIVPCVGGPVSVVINAIFMVIGLTHAQETSGGKAAAAVLVPLVVCCGLAAGFVLLAFASLAW